MKKYGWIIFWILICSIPLWFCIPTFFNTCTEQGCNPIDYARLTDVEYRAEVLDEPGDMGSILITERITFDIHAAFESNLFWELWRDLCEDEYDGVRIRYEVLSVKQILEDGTEIEYEESPRLYWDDDDYVNTNTTYGPGKWYHSRGPYDEDAARYECVFFYVDGVYREKMTFEIQYKMTNAALRYGDCSDLYISMYSGESVYDLESFKAEILIPNELMPSPGNYRYTTYGTTAYDFEVVESDTANPGYHTFMMALDEDELKFASYCEFLEFDLVSYGEDKHIFTQNALQNYYYNDDVLDEIIDEQEEYAAKEGRFRIIKGIVLIIAVIVSGIVIYYAFHKKHKIMSQYFFYDPQTPYEQYREIPSDLDPQFAANLVFCKDKKKANDSDIYAALMLSLARKDYIELKDAGKDDVNIIIKKCPYRGAQSAVPVAGQSSYAQSNYTQTPFANGYNFNASNSMYNSNTPSDLGNAQMLFFNDLTASESHFFSLLVRHAKDNFITMSEFRNAIASDYANTDTFLGKMKSAIVNVGIQQGYLQSATYLRPRDSMLGTASFFAVMGWFFLIVVNLISKKTHMDYAFGAYTIYGISCLISSRYLKKAGRKLVLLTPFGETEYAKWRGLYNFLNSSTLINERSHIELPLWEQYLVYATAFGISDKVTKAIEICCPEYRSSSVLRANGYHSHGIRSYGSGIHNSVRSGSSIARSGGGGFGYGGGGRGGGGGGGGH